MGELTPSVAAVPLRGGEASCVRDATGTRCVQGTAGCCRAMTPEPERLPGSPPSLGCSLCDTCSWSRRAVRIKRIHIHTFLRAFTDTEINESQPLFLLLFGYFVLNAHKSNMDEDCKLILQDENPSLFSSENACGHLLSHVLLSKVQLSLQKSQLPPPSQGSHPALYPPPPVPALQGPGLRSRR